MILRIKGGTRIKSENLQPYSVLMSVYAGEKPLYLQQSLESLYAQTLQADEILIICDGELGKELDAVISDFSEKFGERLTVHRMKTDVGTARCANAGLELCKNEYIIKMDSDDICLEDRAMKQMTYIAENPQTDILGGYIEEFDDSTGESLSIRATPVTHEEILKFAKRRAPFNNQTMVYKKSVAIACGGYDEELLRCEDYDFMVRMLANGAKAANIPEVLVRYRVTPDNIKRRKNFKNTKYFVKVRKKLYKSGFSGFWDYVIPCAGQIIMFILPGFLTGLLYKKMLRKSR